MCKYVFFYKEVTDSVFVCVFMKLTHLAMVQTCSASVSADGWIGFVTMLAAYQTQRMSAPQR